MLHDARASLGFFTRIPVGAASIGSPAPGRVVLLAPFAGAVLALLTGAVLAIAVLVTTHSGGHLLGAAAAVTALAFLTRGLHLDGLADLADGLGASRVPADSLTVMHRSDIGPFGVLAVGCALLLQVSALALLSQVGAGLLALLIAVPAGRLTLSWLCLPNRAAAPGSRLGTWVAGSVPTTSAVLVTAGWLAAAVLTGFLLHPASAATAAATGAAVGAAVLTAPLLARLAETRLQGITGDVLGASVETGQTAALLVLALTLG